MPIQADQSTTGSNSNINNSSPLIKSNTETSHPLSGKNASFRSSADDESTRRQVKLLNSSITMTTKTFMTLYFIDYSHSHEYCRNLFHLLGTNYDREYLKGF